MPLENSLRNVFRFAQLRPTTVVAKADLVALNGSTAFANKLFEVDKPGRRAIAVEYLKDAASTIRSVDDFPVGRAIAAAVDKAAKEEGPAVGELINELLELGLAKNEKEFDQTILALSDFLLAITFAGPDGAQWVPDTQMRSDLTRIYQGYSLVATRDNGTDRSRAVRRILSRPLALPDGFYLARAEYDGEDHENRREDDRDHHESTPGEMEIDAAIEELAKLDRPTFLHVPENENANDEDVLGDDENQRRKVAELHRHAPIAFSLNEKALAKVSAKTRTVMDYYGVDPKTASIDQIVTTLETRREMGQKPEYGHTVSARPGGPAPNQTDNNLNRDARAYVHQAEVADLLVVKQQIKRYEGAEIAHVENIMKGETRSRTHRMFSRREQVLFSETERTVEEERELETADRFELNRESERTLKQDRKLGFELSLSGKYGPTVEFSSNLSVEASTSSEASNKSASTFAQEVVERSLSRISERVKESRTLTIIRESEETNLHEFKNDDKKAEHVVGIYQFLEKVYEAQVFNYGIRQMFDFMVPEPASFIWYVEAEPNQSAQPPTPPTPLSAYVSSWSGILPTNYKGLQIIYGTDEIPPPPPYYLSVMQSVKQGTGQESESGQPRSFGHTDVDIPQGYKPTRAKATAQAFTDNHPRIVIQVGHDQVVMNFTSGYRYALSSGKKIGRMTRYFYDLVTRSFSEGSKLGIDVYGWETATYSIQFEITCERDPSHYANWQKAAYKTLADGYDSQVREYELRVEELEAETRSRADDQDFGESPSVHLKLILTELKKHCISIVTRQWYDTFLATTDDRPPRFDFDRALEDGVYVRFFEQAFEWDQLQYLFYPYYWARQDTWVNRFLRTEVDPVFQEFLQSGFARVVVPVRPGFEIAVNHFFETGNIWNGEGAPPAIGSPTYVSIVEEIMERTGAPQGEFPVGETWDVRLPTPLVLLRIKDSLPKWVRDAPEAWTWTPAPENG